MNNYKHLMYNMMTTAINTAIKYSKYANRGVFMTEKDSNNEQMVC